MNLLRKSMKNFHAINATFTKAIEGLSTDIELAEADMERNEGEIDKLMDQVTELEKKNEILAGDVKAAKEMRDSIRTLQPVNPLDK